MPTGAQSSARQASPDFWPLVAAAVAAAVDIYQGRRQERIQERASNTAVQRRARDLARAGLNPLLAAEGQGASQPQGALVTPGRSFLEGATSGKRLSLESRKLESEIDYNASTAAAARNSGSKAYQEGLRVQWENQHVVPEQLKLLQQQTLEATARAKREGLRLEQEKFAESQYKAFNAFFSGKKDLTWDDVKRLGLGAVLGGMRKFGFGVE